MVKTSEDHRRGHDLRGNHSEPDKTQDVLRETQSNRKDDGCGAQLADERRMVRKTADDHSLQDHRGNHIGKDLSYTDRRDDARMRHGDIACDRRGNQKKEEKSQLNHSSGAG